MGREVANRGYAATSVADVLRSAGVSRRSFYELFASKEDCFLQAYDLGVAVLVDLVVSAVDDSLGRKANVARAVSAYLSALEVNGDLARAFLLEAMGAGAPALERRSEVIRRLAHVIEQVHRASDAAGAALPFHRYHAAAAVINEMVTERMLDRGAKGLNELQPLLEDTLASLLDL